jgi:micrococcal nuclease
VDDKLIATEEDAVRVPKVLALTFVAAMPATAPGPAVAADIRVMLCAELAYRTCVHNGDLIYLSGTPWRLADVVTPDRYLAACPKASNLAWDAAIRLRDLINEGPFDFAEVTVGGEPMAQLNRNGTSLGDTLVAEGLAKPRTAQTPDWCAD